MKDAYKETIVTQHDNYSIEWIQKAWEEQRKKMIQCVFVMKERHLEVSF